MDVQDFKFLLDGTLNLIKHELADRNQGIPGSGSTENLTFIITELEELSKNISEGNVPPPDQRRLQAAFLVTDEWPPEDKLGEKICTLELAYKNLTTS